MYKNRNLYTQLREHVVRKEYSIIIGARQVGKTTLLQQLYIDLKRKHTNVHYLSLENPDLLQQINEHPENIFKYITRPADPLKMNSNNEERVFLLIDEIQYAKNPTNFLKYLYDTYLENLKIIATGSSAFYLDAKFKDSLAGRKTIFQLSGLSFDEFMIFKDKEGLLGEYKKLNSDKEYVSVNKYEFLELLNEYLTYGGYPGVVLENDFEFKKTKLFELRNSFIKRDLLESGIKNETGFFHLMTLLASQIGNLVNRNELSSTIKVDNKTIEHYLFVLQKCFHISLVKPFYNNQRKELTKMPKVYFNDLGLRNALLNRFHPLQNREDKGNLLENYVFQRLSDRYGKDNLFYWRTSDGNEVDFIINESFDRRMAMEVKFDGMAFNKNSFKKFIESYPHIELSCTSYQDSDKSLSVLKI